MVLSIIIPNIKETKETINLCLNMLLIIIKILIM